MIILVVTIQSCNQNLSLQTFYVDNELAPGYTSLDVPVSMLNIDEEKLTAEQLEAYESVEKISMIAYVLESGNEAEMKSEYEEVKAILKDPKYEELMRGGNSTDGKFVVKCVGDGEDVDEFILLGNSNQTGFAVVRILGDDMNFNKLMKLTSVLDESSIEESQIRDITKFFK
ncbi:DUF4252 domain-containing protein [Psychroserpens sp.]|uniref:DUF4252 domain-containing protein n=1 Tax=Psychroserpens sp. TaxID=2020870 RepID=UPI001B296D2A|nr:DUF4252 domain-containing protein [Psychroserpens sp.]MBO6607072.1 DUF4252 domain-containing protein [Psychroserpens sp.]MBO6631987.1 DUF4252 domain-containing protein [Psychroserpens sp.]MBO6654218.1 DUF4252 domain-containing protein [Psychroserpens sp.]MBO6682496.1 DUF4252 domain-containing protein [Psychroserpens sp.]MBO6750844.1 DUF4252 domain-containing protein [Psychroserpens sp.]